MKNFRFDHKDRELIKTIERVVNETTVHQHPFQVGHDVWPFIVFGATPDGTTVIRRGQAEQMKVRSAPVYIATLGGEVAAGGNAMPLEELAGNDIPDELAGLMVHHLSPMRPLQVTERFTGPSPDEALAQLKEDAANRDAAIIETPDEKFWTFSVLTYLDESDRFFPDPVMERYYSGIGYRAAGNRRLH